MRVVDLGGTATSWDLAPVRPAELVLLNLSPDVASTPNTEIVRGDACEPPSELFDRHFDLVYSNSVVEHVGGLFRMRQFAEVVDGIAPHHWVQTPYRYFPIEPHYLFPGLQFLPLAMKARALRYWPLTHSGRIPESESVAVALGVELLSRTEFEFLFPTSSVLEEKVFGVTKSLIAVR